jgi:hypothetical protein
MRLSRQSTTVPNVSKISAFTIEHRPSRYTIRHGRA